MNPDDEPIQIRYYRRFGTITKPVHVSTDGKKTLCGIKLKSTYLEQVKEYRWPYCSKCKEKMPRVFKKGKSTELARFLNV